ncbi:MAG TPA: BamA/TamA family outer membrane protein, partial [Chitinophagaceae bacterium]|nr:BamA/TamA family outer membrane protein [Chitinophagaceae bacterium]
VNLGIEYEINKTNYRLNPKSGSELRLTMSAGTRTVHKNNVILKLSDPSFSYSSLYDSVTGNSYQFRVRMSAAHYFQLGRQSTFKTALNGGLFQSPSIFRNELFQIGGYKLLRGFDEESIYASRYLAATFEYRYLVGLNSFLFTFVDAGWAANTSSSIRTSNGFLGAGLGLAFETKAGIFNISYAAGKRNDTNFNLRQSKIHLGYVSYF